MSVKKNRFLLVIAIVASFIGCLADYLLLYSPQGNYHLGDYRFLLDISKEKLAWGHYLGIFFIPFELLGFWVISKTFETEPKNIQLPFFGAITFIMICGVVYHGTLAFVATILRESNNGNLILESVRNLFEPLSAILGIFFFLFTLYLIYAVLKNKTSLPKKILLFNPALWYVIFVIIYFLAPVIGNVLIVMGFNLANGIFLIACLFYLWNNKIE